MIRYIKGTAPHLLVLTILIVAAIAPFYAMGSGFVEEDVKEDTSIIDYEEAPVILSDVSIDGPTELLVNIDGTFAANVTGTIKNYTWAVDGVDVGVYNDTLVYNWTTIGPRAIGLTIIDDGDNESSATLLVDIQVEITITTVDEANMTVGGADVSLRGDLGYSEFNTTGLDGTFIFTVYSVSGEIHPDEPANMEFTVTGWHSGYSFNTEKFVGITHNLTLYGEGETPSVQDGVYADNIRLEVRMDKNAGIFDTAAGELDAFLQAIDGPTYDGIPQGWKDHLNELESYGSYNNMYYNTATTGGYAEVDTNNDSNLDYFNPWNIREIRYSTNWLLNRQQISENIYDGYGIPQYSAVGQRNPAWDEMFQSLMDARGITSTGDFNTAYNMIQDSMAVAMDHPSLEGELRAPADSPTPFWQYRPPGGDWKDVETHGLIRIEDRRNDIGHRFSNDLEACGIKVFRDDVDSTAVYTWLFTDAANMQWGFYTGGWIASVAVAYQHTNCAMMYTHYYPYMPGDYFDMSTGSSRYAYYNNDPAADELYELALPLMSGQISDEEAYWNTFQNLLDRGVHESVRVFIHTGKDIIPINKEAVTDVATDNVVGWSQVFSPRTVKTVDGNFTAAQYSATGALYMDNWNNIGGFSDYYSVLQSRISRDFATAMNPVTGVPMGMRAEWTDIQRDYQYNEYGDLTANLDVPADSVNYDVFTEEWYEVGSGIKAATAVEYKWHFGTWHSGHNFTMQDLVAYYAFSKQLCWDTGVGDHYFVGSWQANQPYYNNIIGIIFDEANDTVTVYGNYTSPTDPQVGGYYMWMPEVPWQQYEAVSQLIGITTLAPNNTLNNQSYSWSATTGKNYVHWLSTAQGADFDATLANMVADEWVPPYLNASRNSPIPLTPGNDAGDIALMRAFFTEYEHFWITHGPFKLTLHDPTNLVIEFERWTEADGYPWPEDNWAELYHPYIKIASPGNMSTGVPIDQDVYVVYSRNMNTSIEPDLIQETGANPGGWTFLGWQTSYQPNDTAIWSHDNWTHGDSVTIKVFNAEDDNGYKALNYTWSFTTEEYINSHPNAPENPSPMDGETEISIDPTLRVNVTDPDGDTMTVTFYDASDDSLIDTASNVSSGSTASITWSGLDELTEYSWYAVADDGEYTSTSPTWSFTTEDTTPPEVVSVEPVDGAVDVEIDTQIVITFSEPMNTVSVEDSFVIDISGTFNWNSDETILTFTPDTDMEYSFVYTLTVGADSEDKNGLTMAADYTFSFTTMEEPEEPDEPPEVIIHTPEVGDEYERGTVVYINWTATDDRTLPENPITIEISYDSGTTWETLTEEIVNSGTSTWNPTDVYDRVDIRITCIDSIGQTIMETTGSFSIVDTTPPTVTHTVPEDGDIRVEVTTRIVFEFDESIDEDSVEISVSSEEGEVEGTWALSNMGRSLTFTPVEDLAYDTQYTVSIILDDVHENGIENHLSFTTTSEEEPTVPSDFNVMDYSWLFLLIIFMVALILVLLIKKKRKPKKMVVSALTGTELERAKESLNQQRTDEQIEDLGKNEPEEEHNEKKSEDETDSGEEGTVAYVETRTPWDRLG